MKSRKTLKVPTKKNLNIEVINTYKVGGKINIRVRLVPSETKSTVFLNSKRSSITLASTTCSNYSKPGQIKIFVSLSKPCIAKPDDFIEPLANLCIPSTEEYMKHRHLSEPIPEIISINPHKKDLQKQVKRPSNSLNLPSQKVTKSKPALLPKQKTVLKKSIGKKYFK